MTWAVTQIKGGPDLEHSWMPDEQEATSSCEETEVSVDESSLCSKKFGISVRTVLSVLDA